MYQTDIKENLEVKLFVILELFHTTNYNTQHFNSALFLSIMCVA